jgi:hypothetical protein
LILATSTNLTLTRDMATTVVSELRTIMVCPRSL